MYKRHIRTPEDLRDNYDEIVRLAEQGDTVIIAENGVQQLAIVNYKDFCSWIEDLHREYIKEELDKSILEASDPNTRFISHEEMKATLKARREKRNQ